MGIKSICIDINVVPSITMTISLEFNGEVNYNVQINSLNVAISAAFNKDGDYCAVSGEVFFFFFLFQVGRSQKLKWYFRV